MKDLKQELNGIDATWLAIDLAGNVAVFTTAGAGPVPASAIVNVADSDSAIELLEEASDFTLLEKYARPDDFINYAKRGLFAYDWSDVHKPLAQSTGCYRLVAKPTRPVSLTRLPLSFQALASQTLFSDVEFGFAMVSVGT